MRHLPFRLFGLVLLLGVSACQPTSTADKLPDPAQWGTAVTTPVDIFLDADTANEMDDLYAVAHLIADPHAKLTTLSSAHFNNVEIGTKGRWHDYDVPRDLDRGLNTVSASQVENEIILKLLNRMDIPHPVGADEMLGFSWGYFEGAPVPDAPAIDAMIKAARGASPDSKINLVAVGPLTNIAAAVIKAPDIAPNIQVWWLGAGYDADTGIWNKNRFNVRNDLNAADYLLDRDDVALIMLPTEVAQDLMFDRDRTHAALSNIDHPLATHLWERWDFVSAEQSWIMWDLALTLAITHPEWAQVTPVSAPPENTRQSVDMITAINAPAMEAHFFDTLTHYSGTRPPP